MFNPASIAVIGASKNKEKLGWQVLNNIQKTGFKGKLYPVNPKHKKINGLAVHKDVADIKESPDLAVIIIPAKAVVPVVKSCAQKGIKNIIIVSAGFSEAGKEGKQREKELQELARERELNILGPNCLGLINASANLNSTFADFSVTPNKKGSKVAFVSQSGAIGSAFFDWSRAEKTGVDYFISVGNKAVLDENDLLEYFAEEDEVGVVVAYLEEIARGKRFMEKVSRLAQVKPVVVLKAGKTEAGGKATMSHTGSLAGSQQAVETGLKRSGAIIVDNLEELFALIKFLQIRLTKNISDKKDRNREVYMISNAGGPLVITVDELARFNFDLPDFNSRLSNSLKKQLPELTAYHNPLDILGDADSERYKKALEVAVKKGEATDILVLLTPQTSTEIDKTAEVINKIASDNPAKMITTSFIGGSSLSGARDKLRQGEAVDFDYPGRAAFCLARFAEYRDKIKNLRPYKYSAEKEVQGKNKHKDFLTSLELLQKYDISVVETKVVEKDKDLKQLKYPAVLKMAGKEIVHKTEAQAVATGLDSSKQAREAFRNFQKKFGRQGYCVAQPMMETGVEMILGFKRDPSFGAIIIVGWGGIYTEVLRDIETEADDVCKTRAKQAIKNLQVYPILKGTRGEKGYDVDSLAQAMVNLGKLARQNQDIQELDINPLFVQEKGCVAADVRIISKE